MPDPVDPNALAPSDRLADRGAALTVALEALDRLAALGEDVEDEWTYVTTLADAGRARLRAAAGPDPLVALAPARAAAVTAAAGEAARITDSHRAIDWLSTFPAVVELALTDELAVEYRAAPPRAAPGAVPPRAGPATPPPAGSPGPFGDGA